MNNSAASTAKTKTHNSDILKKYGALFVLILVTLLNCIFTPNFSNVNVMWNIIIQVTTVMLVALGMTAVISLGGIDISVGSIMAISSIVVAKFLDLGVVPAILITLAIAAVFGIFSGFIVSKFNIQPIIVTLSVMIAGRGIGQVINDAQLLNFYNPEFSAIGTYKVFGVIPIQAFIMLVFIGIFLFVMKKTVFGTYIQAMGDNKKASSLSGVNTVFIVIAVYTISSIMAGMAGIVETARLSAADANAIGKSIELDAIAAVVVGGTPMTGGVANITGTVIGALIMQIITVSVNMNNIPFAYSLVLKSLIIVVAIYLQRDKNA